jgi:hypothetical protein
MALAPAGAAPKAHISHMIQQMNGTGRALSPAQTPGNAASKEAGPSLEVQHGGVLPASQAPGLLLQFTDSVAEQGFERWHALRMMPGDASMSAMWPGVIFLAPLPQLCQGHVSLGQALPMLVGGPHGAGLGRQAASLHALSTCLHHRQCMHACM